MLPKKLVRLISVIATVFFIQSCKLERINPRCATITTSSIAKHYGEIVEIKGSNFNKGQPQLYTIKIADKKVDILDVPDSNTLRFTVPIGIGSGPLTISLGGGEECGKINFIYRYKINSSEIKNPFSGTVRDRTCPTCFWSPQGIDIDPDGNIIVADRDNNVIKIIKMTDPSNPKIFAGIKSDVGHYLDNVNQLIAQFNQPTDVVIIAGAVYVADKNNNCIRKISGGGVATYAGSQSYSGPPYPGGHRLQNARFLNPTGIASDLSKFIFITEPNLGRVSLINLENNDVSALPSSWSTTNHSFVSPFGVAFSGSRASLFIADLGSMQGLKGVSLEGKITPISFGAGVANGIRDVSSDDGGNLFVLDNQKQVFVIYPDNSSEVIAGLGINGITLDSPSAIGVDRKNNYLYISEESKNIIIQIPFR